MKVSEFILKLSAYATQSPENGSAEVLIQSFDEMAYAILGANDCKGMGAGQHALVLVPDLNVSIKLKELKVQ